VCRSQHRLTWGSISIVLVWLKLRLANTLQCAVGHMKALKDFLSVGIQWTGIVPARPDLKEVCAVSADMFSTKPVQPVLKHMADRLNASRASAGLTLSRPNLADGIYEKSSVSAVLAKLTRAGVIKRVRAGRKGCAHEEVARTVFNPALLAMALAWQEKHQSNLELGLRGAAALPARCMVKTPLIWTDHPANVEPVRVPKDQRPKIGIASVQKLDTAIYTPPPPPPPRGGA
jgi:hypothetical protein